MFHFLTESEDRARYVEHVKQTVKVGGTVIIATFAPDGPEKCSGLPVMRYSPESLARELGDDFSIVQALPHVHQTPWGTAPVVPVFPFRSPACGTQMTCEERYLSSTAITWAG